MVDSRCKRHAKPRHVGREEGRAAPTLGIDMESWSAGRKKKSNAHSGAWRKKTNKAGRVRDAGLTRGHDWPRRGSRLKDGKGDDRLVGGTGSWDDGLWRATRPGAVGVSDRPSQGTEQLRRVAGRTRTGTGRRRETLRAGGLASGRRCSLVPSRAQPLAASHAASPNAALWR